jgi:L-aspartate oxidase
MKSDRKKRSGVVCSELARPAVSWPKPVDTAQVRDLMWRSVGLFRTREGLLNAVSRLDDLEKRAAPDASAPDADLWRQFNLITVARLIARAALGREESRGGHFRADFPARDDLHWKIHLVDMRPD